MKNQKLRFGVFLPAWDFDPNAGGDNVAGGTPVEWKDVMSRAKLCEELGYHSVLVGEHLFRGLQGNILDPWTILSAVAARTDKIRLGQFVMCNELRHPSLFAKMASTLDIVSNGRLEIGLGAGWMADEFQRNGLHWDPARLRVERLQESVEILKRLFEDGKASYSGKYYHLTDAICEPRPLQRPRPPIWIGGEGEKYLLRTVAAVGDGCNFGGSPETYSRKIDVLKEHSLAVGRDPSAIMKSWNGAIIIGKSEGEASTKAHSVKPTAMTEDDFESRQIIGTPSQCVRKIEEYASLGVEYITIHGTSKMSDDDLVLFANEVMSSF